MLMIREPNPSYDMIYWKPSDSRKGIVEFDHAENKENVEVI